MTRPEVRTIIDHALALLRTQSPAALTALGPWLTRRHIHWCQQHWAEREPEDDAAMQVIREAAAVLQRTTLTRADWEVLLDLLRDATTDAVTPNPDVHAVLAKVQRMLAEEDTQCT
jgi:hypothetical protein